MTVTLDKVALWGRSLGEYVRMFALGERDLARDILDCAGGPASFNCEMHRLGRAVVSADPIYRFSATELAKRIEETRHAILSKTAESQENFVWKEVQSIEHLGEVRMRAMKLFLDDLPVGLAEGRYLPAELPSLPFRDRQFELALCSHFLFTYSDLLPLEFHLASVRELCRVAGEARIFPLLPNFGHGNSAHLTPLVERLAAEGYRCEVLPVPYEFQKDGNKMLRAAGGDWPGAPGRS